MQISYKIMENTEALLGSLTCFSILTACYKARTRSAPDYNHKPVGRVPVLRPGYGCSQEHYASSPCNMLSKSKDHGKHCVKSA